MDYEKTILSHRAWLHNYIRRKVKNEQDTEDLAQQTLITAFNYIDSYEKLQNARSILQNTANFKIMSYWRKFRRSIQPDSLDSITYRRGDTIVGLEYDDFLEGNINIQSEAELYVLIDNVKDIAESVTPIAEGVSNLDILFGDFRPCIEAKNLGININTLMKRKRALHKMLRDKLETGKLYSIKQYETPTNTNSPIRV